MTIPKPWGGGEFDRQCRLSGQQRREDVEYLRHPEVRRVSLASKSKVLANLGVDGPEKILEFTFVDHHLPKGGEKPTDANQGCVSKSTAPNCHPRISEASCPPACLPQSISRLRPLLTFPSRGSVAPPENRPRPNPLSHTSGPT